MYDSVKAIFTTIRDIWKGESVHQSNCPKIYNSLERVSTRKLRRMVRQDNWRYEGPVGKADHNYFN